MIGGKEGRRGRKMNTFDVYPRLRVFDECSGTRNDAQGPVRVRRSQ